MADSAGAAVWRWDQQEPFGNNPADENPSGLGVFDLPLRLPGQYYEKETTLHYNMARNYWPDGGRYVEADPLGIATTRPGVRTTELNHLYTYANNSPVAAIDPSGLKPYEFQVKIGGGVGHYVLGGLVYTANIKDLQTGAVCKYQIRCIGIGVGLPEFGVTSAPTTFDDGQKCSSCRDFSGVGYIGNASGVAGGGVTVGGGIKIPNGPFIANPYFQGDYGGFRIGVNHNVCYFALQ